ncbi:2-methylfumaryl-CoA isomerase [Thermocatellispora tengchongensis]|uniref:2-methylfumaryl-CoA isomerase n=1 Tax=Thermocatellispora tengchongensis TaxID=1073253 RepID=A0A840P645_9ACTN|nr:CoA transferase [Thermocatellispora tengchongensis]MBB5133331.1 2-methylfumaryl-CoA isomerase [Thermocatellispora tengchongensis]
MTLAPPPGRPLAGMRIVEVSAFVAAPLGGMTLAQLGAEVVRVDPIGGAADRSRWPLAPSGASMYWAGLNKAKRSLCVDLRSPEGQELVTRLVAESGPDGGIVLTNAVGRPWLGHHALTRHRPDLIHVAIEGHHDGTPAVDYTVNAAVGFPMVTGPEGHAGPVNHVLPAWDIACGLYAAIAILAAERRRRATGQGQALRVALHDVALAMAGNLGFLAEAQIGGVPRPRVGNHLYGGFGRDFATRDGRRVMVVALTARHWRDLVEVTGLKAAVTALEGALGADFSTEGDRYRHREVLAGLLAGWFAGHDLAQVEDRLRRTSALWSVYRTFAELVGERAGELRANPMMALLDQPGIGEHLAPGCPIDPGDAARPEVVRAPELGEHTAEILRGLGLTAAEIEDLRARGVVAGPAGAGPVGDA